MLKRLFLPVTGFAALHAAAGLAQGTIPAQQPTPIPSLPAPAAPAIPQQTPAAPVPNAPGTPAAYPAPTPAQTIDSRPAYDQQPAQPQSVPVPQQTAPPAVIPAAPTPANPYVAMPAYAPDGKAQRPYQPYGVPDEDKHQDHDGSTYIPVDSWICPAMTRLYSLGFADTEFLSMRPWTRKALLHILEESEDTIMDSDSQEAQDIYVAVRREVRDEYTDGLTDRGILYGTKAVYDRAMVITGTPLRDSYHLGQTIVNDYGRPYQNGFSNIAGFHEIAEYGRFSLDVRGEYQHAPSAAGYSQYLSSELSLTDQIPYDTYNLKQSTIPTGPIPAANPFRLMEATLSFHLLGHEISGGKSDAWLGPAQGGSVAWSNNAENIYSFRINRVEPLHIPFVSALLGPVRYDFFYGSLKGHTDPNSPWVHSEMFAFKPTSNFEFGFQRTIIFGGKGHEPVTIHTFLKGFFDPNDTTNDEKYSRDDPGARFTAFNASYRLPLMRKYMTFYVDSEAHDDVTPISAPRRAAFRTGLFLSQFPKANKLSLRVEAVDFDPRVARSDRGSFNYYETIQRQGYTNKGFIMGDWIGREAKGGQAWLTYHLSGNEWVELEYLNKKTPKDFIPGTFDVTQGFAKQNNPGGTTQNQFKASVLKRFDHDNIELNASFQYEAWKAPIYMPGRQTDTTTAVQITFFPGLKSIKK